MRQQYTNRPGRSGAVESQPKGKTSVLKLLAFFGFGIGVLGGYHFLGSPHKSLSAVRRNTIQEIHAFHGGDASIHDAVTGKAARSAAKEHLPAPARRVGTPDVVVVAAPPPHVLVGDTDERHPKHKNAILAGQSSHDEHKSDALSAMQKQRSDVSESEEHKAGAATTTATHPASNATASSATLAAGNATASTAGSTGSSATATAGTDKRQEEKVVRRKIDPKALAAAIAAASGHDEHAAAAAGGTGGTSNVTASAATAATTQQDATAGGAASKADGASASKDSHASNILTAEQLHDGKVQPDDHAAAVHLTGDKPSGKSSSNNAAPLPATTAEATGVTGAAAAGGTAGGAAAAGGTGTGGTGGTSTARPKGDTIHTLFTSNGSPYQNFQARIMVGTYNIVRKQPGGEHMVAITRILHRTKLDGFEIEIPTFRANPLQPECDKWCWFPVADRANAVKQWIAAADKDPSLVQGAWLLLLESDYVWIKPMPVPGDAWDPKVPGRSFAFDYISANHAIVGEILKERCPDCDPKTVPNSGPAPVLLRFDDLKKATPVWEELTNWIETHEHAKKQLGWVREMYAWDIAVAMFKINLINEGPKTSCLISQPPHDHSAYNTSMYHYTWGSIWSQNGKEVYKWDKRFHTDVKESLKVPLLDLPPQVNDTSYKQHDGVIIDKALRDTLADMLERMNAAIATLPDLTGKVAVSR